MLTVIRASDILQHHGVIAAAEPQPQSNLEWKFIRLAALRVNTAADRAWQRLQKQAAAEKIPFRRAVGPSGTCGYTLLYRNTPELRAFVTALNRIAVAVRAPEDVTAALALRAVLLHKAYPVTSPKSMDFLRALGLSDSTAQAAAEPRVKLSLSGMLRQITQGLGDRQVHRTVDGVEYTLQAGNSGLTDYPWLIVRRWLAPGVMYRVYVTPLDRQRQETSDLDLEFRDDSAPDARIHEAKDSRDLLHRILALIAERSRNQAQAAAEPGRSSLELLAGADWLVFAGQYRGWKHYDSQYFRLSVSAQGDLAVAAIGRGSHRYIAQLQQVPAGVAPRMIQAVGKLDAALRKLNARLRFSPAGITRAATTLVRKVFPKAVVRLTENLDGDPELEVHDE